MAFKSIEELAKEFPKQFGEGGTTPCFSGYPEGWHHIIRNVCKKVDAARIPIKWAQIKEKFGGLRMYDAVNESYSELVDMYEWISEAERLSMITCQDCGAKGKQTTIRNYVCTLCNSCKARREAH